MLESFKEKVINNDSRSVTLYWGGRYENDLYYDPKDIFNKLIYHPVLSRESNKWPGDHGYVQDILLKKNVDLTKVQVYACGSENMVRSSRIKLIEAGLSPNNFFADMFTSTGN